MGGLSPGVVLVAGSCWLQVPRVRRRQIRTALRVARQTGRLGLPEALGLLMVLTRQGLSPAAGAQADCCSALWLYIELVTVTEAWENGH